MSKAALRGAENFRYFADQVVQARDGQTLQSPTLLNITTRVPIGPGGCHYPVEHTVHVCRHGRSRQLWRRAVRLFTNPPRPHL